MADIPVSPAILSEETNALTQDRIIGGNGASISIGAQILGWIKAKRSQISPTSHSFPVVESPVCLGTIFNHPQSMIGGDSEDWLKICRTPV
jgi:hypothetical protein